jgi:hypothetical protein
MEGDAMKRFLERFFPATRPAHPRSGGHGRHKHDAAHDGFRTPRGQGPFLLSCDGRVIPLRKARFLRHY